MAKIGLNNFRYGLLTENPDGTASYAGSEIAEAAERIGFGGIIVSSKLTSYRIEQLDG